MNPFKTSTTIQWLVCMPLYTAILIRVLIRVLKLVSIFVVGNHFPGQRSLKSRDVANPGDKILRRLPEV